MLNNNLVEFHHHLYKKRKKKYYVDKMIMRFLKNAIFKIRRIMMEKHLKEIKNEKGRGNEVEKGQENEVEKGRGNAVEKGQENEVKKGEGDEVEKSPEREDQEVVIEKTTNVIEVGVTLEKKRRKRRMEKEEKEVTKEEKEVVKDQEKEVKIGRETGEINPLAVIEVDDQGAVTENDVRDLEIGSGQDL
jgi:hypothetical protein